MNELNFKDNNEIQEITIKEPENYIINVSSKKKPKSYKLVAKLILKKFGILEL